jgi:hypothetical protein
MNLQSLVWFLQAIAHQYRFRLRPVKHFQSAVREFFQRKRLVAALCQRKAIFMGSKIYFDSRTDDLSTADLLHYCLRFTGSVTRLSKELGSKPTTVVNWFKASKLPSTKSIAKIEALKARLDALAISRLEIENPNINQENPRQTKSK